MTRLGLGILKERPREARPTLAAPGPRCDDDEDDRIFRLRAARLVDKMKN
jgi:hypothetical protein